MISASAVFLVPQLRLGTASAKLRFALCPPTLEGTRQTESRQTASQTELGDQGKRKSAPWLEPFAVRAEKDEQTVLTSRHRGDGA